jgi:hypothetical protein
MCIKEDFDWLRRGVIGSFFLGLLILIMPCSVFGSANVTLAWLPSSDPIVAGYNIYYGGTSGDYTNKTSAGTATSLTISNLVNGNTYYFAATTYSAAGAESSLSSEVIYTVPVNPVNQPPTLNPIGNLTLNENAGAQSVNLANITSGAANEIQTLTVTAVSSNPGLIPNPNVNYTSANTTGSLSFTPVANANGSATVTVTVNDGGVSNNLVTRSFTVSVQTFSEHILPTIQITAPTANQQWSNATVTVSGKAGDNVAVSSVYYSLNGSSWTTATTANNWTNWSGSLTLTPGTNTVQAYAVDSSGNLSPTNTVRFEYVVLMPLSVSINGKGTLNPNYNGKLLAINENYIMTASASAGFGFTNWTGGLTTNRATLLFTMTTNLSLTANFVDVQKPTASIVSPTLNQQWSNATVTVSGKAGDNVAVSSVYYSLNGGLWTNATTANNWTNWTGSPMTLNPGTNIFQAYAVDSSGNLSPTNTVRFEYVVLMPLSVSINGKGTLNPNYNGKLLAINENYIMTAKAPAGSAFTNWTDGSGNLLTNRATIRFTMATNLSLTANFMDVPTSSGTPSNPQYGGGGTYIGGGTYLAVRALVITPPETATLTPGSFVNGQFALTVSGATNVPCIVQASTNLVDWVSVQTNTAPFIYVDTDAGQFRQRYYRTVYVQ